MEKNRYFKLKNLEKNIGYTFKDKKLLINALSHSSYANEVKGQEDNERLEFLGDSILGFVVSNYIYNKKRELPEGELTKIRASIVCEKSLKKVADNIHLSEYILLGKGEQRTGGNRRSSILSDAVEAIIAAIYIDSDIKTASKIVINFLSDNIKDAISNDVTDYKSKLQEYIQGKRRSDIHYELIREEGPDHSKKFYVKVVNENIVLGEGKGSSKKRAEQDAAKNALRVIK